MSDFRVTLGLNWDEAKIELEKLEQKVENFIKRKHEKNIDINYNIKDVSKLTEASRQIQELERRMGSFSSGGKGLSIDTKSLENSLEKILKAIEKIANAFGAVDKKNGITNLLDNINMIETHLNDTRKEISKLSSDLKGLGNQKFDLNIDFGLDKSQNKPTEQLDKELDLLEKQAKEYEKYLNKVYSKSNKKGVEGTSVLFGQAGIKQQVLTTTLSKMQSQDPSRQIAAYKEYIKIIKEAAKIANVTLEPAELRLSTDGVIDDLNKIENESKDTEQKLKEIFSGGIDSDKLSTQLESIVVDLKEIKDALQGLSSGISLDGLTQSFDRLSETLEQVMVNAKLLQDVLDSGFANMSGVNNKNTLDNIGNSNKAITDAQRVGREIGDAVSRSAQQSINTGNIIDKYVSDLMSKYGIVGKKGSKAFEEIRQAIVNYKRELSSADDMDVFGDFSNTTGIGQITSALTNHIKIVDEAKNGYAELAEYIKRINNSGAKIHLPDTIRQEYGDDFKSMRSQLGKAFTTGQGSDFEGFVQELNSQLGNVVDLSNGAEAAFADLVNKVNSAKGSKFISGDDLFRVGFDIEDMETDIIVALGNIEEEEREVALASMNAANDVTQSQQKMQQAYRETANEYRRIRTEASPESLDNLDIALDNLGFDEKSIQAIKKNLDDLGITVKRVTTALNDDGSIKLTVKGIDDAERAVTVVKRVRQVVGESGEEFKVSGATTVIQDFDEIENKAKELLNTTKQMSKLEIDILKLDSNKNVNELEVLENQLESLKREYNETKSYIDSSGFKIDTSQIDAIVNKTESEITQLKAKYADARAELAREIKIDIETGNFDKSVRNIESKYNGLSRELQEATEGYNKFQRAVNNVNIAAQSGDDKALIRAMNEYKVALKKVDNQLDENIKKQKEYNASLKLKDDISTFQSKIDAWLKKNSAAAKEFGAEMLKLKAQAESCDRTELNHLEREFKQVDKAAEAAGKKAMSVGDRLKTQFAKYSTYFSAASVFMYVEQGLRDMFEQVVAIDTAMTELKKVTDETNATYNKFLTNAASRASEIGTTISDYISSTADFSRLGYDFVESQTLSEVANIYKVVGDEIDSVDTASQSVISTMKAFKIEAADSMSIVDKFNEVSNNFAISSGGIGEALTRSASSLAAANNDLDESIALITAANSVVDLCHAA